MKSSAGASAGRPEKRFTARSKTPPGVDGCRATPVRRAERRQHQRGTSCRREVRAHMRGLVGRVLVVLVEARLPRRLLRRRIDLDRAREAAKRSQYLRASRCRPAGRARARPARPARHCAPPKRRAHAGPAPRRGRRTHRVPGVARSPSRAPSTEAQRAEAEAREARARPPACPVPVCVHEACHTLHSRPHTEAKATRRAWPTLPVSRGGSGRSLTSAGHATRWLHRSSSWRQRAASILRSRADGCRRKPATLLGRGRLAQLGEHQLDKLGVTGSSPVAPTSEAPASAGVSHFRGLVGIRARGHFLAKTIEVDVELAADRVPPALQ